MIDNQEVCKKVITMADMEYNQTLCCNWIRKNLKTIKRINYSDSSLLILRAAQRELGAEITHGELKQAMIRSGYIAWTGWEEGNYNKWFFNVSQNSVKKALNKKLSHTGRNQR